MTLDVTWDGVALARGAVAREQDGGWFVELEQPMPVGTLLTLAGEVQATVQVARVHEGLGAGMLVKRVENRQPATGDRKPETGEAAPVEAKAEAKEEAPEDNGGGGKRKKKGRKG